MLFRLLFLMNFSVHLFNYLILQFNFLDYLFQIHYFPTFFLPQPNFVNYYLS